MEFIRHKRLLALIGIITLILGTILPYFTFSLLGYSQSISLWDYWDGKVIVVLTIANALFIFKDYIEKYIPQLFTTSLGRKIANVTNPKISLIPTILVIGFVIYLNTKFDFNSEYLKNGLGFYLLWLGIIVMAAHSFIYKGSYKRVSFSNANNINNSNNLYDQTTQFQQSIQNNSMQNKQNNMVQNLVQTPQGNIKYCPNCGTAIDINASNCPRCMLRF